MARDVSVFPRLPSWFLGSVGVALALTGPLAVVFSVGVPDEINRPLASDRGEAVGHPVELLSLAEGEQRTHRVPLWRIGPGDLSGADRIHLLLAGFNTRPTIELATLRVGTCVFQLATPTVFADGDHLPLQRTSPCADASSSTAELTVTIRGPGRLAWWTWDRLAHNAVQDTGLSLTPSDHPGPMRSMARGRVVEVRPGPSVSRAALLSWLHGDPTGGLAWRWLMFVGALAVLGASGLAMGGRAATAAGGASLALAVSLAWVIVMPPLQGADEPDHLLSAAEVTGHPRLAAELPALAQRVHFERMRWHSYERFTPVDREAPYRVPWTGDIHSERMQSRSPFTAAFWRLTAPAIPFDAGGTLRRMRVTNALVFGLVVGLALLLVSIDAGRLSGWLLAGVALMPTLPYFGAMVSDWAFMASWSVLLGGAIILLIHGRSAVPHSGLAIGLSAALLLGTGMVALTALPLVGAALIGYLVVAGDTRRPVIFWGGMAVGGAVAWWLLADLATVGFQRFDADGRTTFQALLRVTNTALAGFASAPWILLVAALIGLVVDVVLHPVRIRRVERTAGRMVARSTAGLIAVIAAAQLLLSTVASFPVLAGLEPTQVAGPVAYLKSAGAVLATSARLRDFDLLTFSSLWGGFGWLDAILPAAFLAPIVVALCLCWIAVWRTTSGRVAALTVFVFAGGVIGAAMTIVAAALMGRNLHGRYLLPVAVPIVMAVAASAGGWIATQPRSWIRWSVALGLAGFHGLCLAWVLQRYL